ncbi:MAG: hypothetical protein ABSD11_17460 [Methylocella sp.]
MTKQSEQLAKLTFENEQLKARIAALEARVPPEPPPLMMSDLKVVGYQRPTLSLPEAAWMPNRDELKNLGRIVHAKYPYLIEWTSEWLDQFHVCLLAVNHLGRTPKPNRDYGVPIGDWLTNHRYFGEIDRGPLMSAIAASGDVMFSGFGERDMLSGTFPMAGIAGRDRGTPPVRSAWKKVLAEGRLIGESAGAQANQDRPFDRWDNPKATVTLLPEYDRSR